MTDLPASWQTDPTGRHDHRYWDGTGWTDHVADAGVASNDPYTEPEPEPTPEPVPTPEPEAETDAPSETTAETDAIVDAAPAAAGPSGWNRPSEPTTPEPEGPAEASPVAGWAPAASTAWPTDPTTVTPAATEADAPTEVAPVVDHSPLPSLPSPSGPTGPTGPDTGGGSDSTRRNLLIGLGILVVVAIVAFLALSSDDDDSGADAISARLADSIQDDADLSSDDADCLADRIVDQVGADRLDDVDFDSSAAPPGDVGDDFLEAYGDAVRECDVNPVGADETEGSTDSEVSIPDIGDLDSFRELLAEQYEETLGLPRDKAECLADAMGEAVSEGQLDQQDAFGDFFDYLDSCDISLDEITGANP